MAELGVLGHLVLSLELVALSPARPNPGCRLEASISEPEGSQLQSPGSRWSCGCSSVASHGCDVAGGSTRAQALAEVKAERLRFSRAPSCARLPASTRRAMPEPSGC